MDYEKLGKNISIARNKKHLTQEQLAEKIDVSTVFISQIETAVRKPSLETVYKLSLALNTTIDSLIGSDNIQTRYNEITMLLKGKNDNEVSFIINILREICANISDGKIVNNW